MHHWPNFGLADYVLAKTLTDPDKPFERWEDEYLSAFGTAAPEARAYFAFWRSRWDAQILPNLGEILGTSCDFTRGLYRDAARYYQVETFDQAEALLAPAAAKPLGPAERRQLDRAILSVRHAKQVFLALTSQGTEQHRQARRLLDFRERNRDRLNFLWANLEAAEIRMGDATGIRKAALFRDYLDDYFALPRTWFFALDPGNAGLAEKWPDKPIADLRREGWVKLSTAYWMRSPQKSGLPYDPDFLERVRSYRGAAWYGAGAAIPPEWKGREIFLYFLSAPSACRVFVNGRPAGDSAAAGSGGAARVARIDAQVDWMKPEQAILVRIEDTEGRGLNDAVYAVSRPAPAPEAP